MKVRPLSESQYFAVMLLLNAKINIKFHIKCQLHDNKTLTGRILVLIEISKIPEINYRSVVYLSLN